ncbi:hypothetical protein CVT24_009822 [Panaeolus cyanescens]|uniref:Uncharacterized protein n=1 Tax=Panaeolus cyanescens TaxID=181874 RepID=A0A409X799_9AGAR|nr:hypothetical protein CVT24_009822 [Panaeolus cyanescens]
MSGLRGYQIDLEKANGVEDLPEHPEDQKIWLPSDLPADVREELCYEGLANQEEKLRTGQCTDSLESLRNSLKLKLRLLKDKNQNVRGQKEGTRSRTLIDRAHEKAMVAAEKYRWARSRRMALSGDGDWTKTFKVLNDGDIRSFRDAEPRKAGGRKGTLEDDQVEEAMAVESSNDVEEENVELESGRREASGETRRTLSWIWLLPKSSDAIDDDENDSYLRVEWAKSRARCARAKEEVELVKEEMRRTLEFLTWKRKWWIAQVGMRNSRGALEEGLRAFAMKSAEHQGQLALRFRQMWVAPLGSFSRAEFARAHLDEAEEAEKPGMDEEEEEDEIEEVRVEDDEE